MLSKAYGNYSQNSGHQLYHPYSIHVPNHAPLSLIDQRPTIERETDESHSNEDRQEIGDITSSARRAWIKIVGHCTSESVKSTSRNG